MILKRLIKEGESCWLASGGPRMSAVAVHAEAGTVEVEWPDSNGNIQHDEFPDACLSSVDPATFTADEWNERIVASE